MPGVPTPRHPRYIRFLASGACVGAVLAVVLGLLAPAAQYSHRQIVLYLLLMLGSLGALLGGVVAVLVESRQRR